MSAWLRRSAPGGPWKRRRWWRSGTQAARSSVPALELTSPADRTVADQPQITVRGTTDATQVYIGVGGNVQPVTPQNGVFEATVPLAVGGNKITVVAQAADGGTNMRQVTVVSFGTRVGGFMTHQATTTGPAHTSIPPTPSTIPASSTSRDSTSTSRATTRSSWPPSGAR